MSVYNHTQTMLNAEWRIKHDLGTYPVSDVTVMDNGNIVKTLPLAVEYVDANNIVIRFSEPRRGSARLVGGNNFVLTQPE